MKITTDTYRAAYPNINDDFTVDQCSDRYTDEEHGVWSALFERQKELLDGRACDAFLDGMKNLDLAPDRIPDFERLSEKLSARTGWRVVPVPGLLPDDAFFKHLSERRFPAGCFIRRRDQLDYIEEPDVFHDIFGHAPMLYDPVFAQVMERFGELGLRALKSRALKKIARLYWFTIEFGLIETKRGLRIYGAGIVSSPGETVYSLENESPNRVYFDLERLLRTNYCISHFQDTYFLLRSFGELFDALDALGSGFDQVIGHIAKSKILKPWTLTRRDRVQHRGTHTHAHPLQTAA